MLSENYTVLKEFRTVFNAEQFNEKIVHVLFKYDFIVGDFADDQLRLKGFYHNRRRNVEPGLKASAIEKYIVESCNYMCPHYVVEKIKTKSSQNRNRNRRRRSKPKADAASSTVDTTKVVNKTTATKTAKAKATDKNAATKADKTKASTKKTTAAKNTRAKTTNKRTATKTPRTKTPAKKTTATTAPKVEKTQAQTKKD